MLSLMRKHAKSWLIKFLIAIIAAVFVFYFGYSLRSGRESRVAYVNGEVISRDEYQKTYRELLNQYRMMNKARWNDEMIRKLDLESQALEKAIDRKLISQEARRLGLDVTKDEIQKAILEYSEFQENGQFSMSQYRLVLNSIQMKEEDFEASMGHSLLERKLRQFLFCFMEVTDQEVLDYYTYANEKIKLSFVQFKPSKFIKSITPDKDSMQEYFEKHKEDYRVPEKIKIAYLAVDPRTFRDQVKIDDQKVADYYEYNINRFSEPKQVKASHILFKLSEGATEAEERRVREKAKAVLEELRQGKDFSALAEKYSEWPSKAKGGDLGYFSRGQMSKLFGDRAFEDAAFRLDKGEMSDLVRTRFGYHIIKVEDIKEAKTKTLDEVKGQIVETLITNASAELAHEKGLSLIDQMPYDVDLAKYAAEHEFDVKLTDYFSQDELIPGIGGNEKLRKSLFGLEEGETSDLIELKDKFYIFQVADRKASYVPEMEKVADKVKKDVAGFLAEQEARSAAEKYLGELQNGKEWDILAKENHLGPQETGFFARGRRIPQIGYEPELQEKAFGLSEDKRYPDVIFENNAGAFVIRWEGYEGIDEKKYQEEKERYRFSLVQMKHGRAFETWLENLRKNADIEKLLPM